jgi:hypothetical protein
MKILYIGPYRDGTLTSQLIIDNILSLQATGVDVVCRPTSQIDAFKDDPCPIEQFENKDLNNIDTVVQHIDPQFFEYKNGVKNVGILSCQASSAQKAAWANSCNLMDEIWVSNTNALRVGLECGIKQPIKVVFHGRNDQPEVDNNVIIDGIDDKCVFYTITQLNRMNNLPGLLRSYYSTFSSRDDVILLIKIDIPDQSLEYIANAMKRLTMDIKGAIKVYSKDQNYPKIMVICDRLKDQQLAQLHNLSDIFVTCCRGNDWDIYAHDAMIAGNPIICTDCGCFPDLCYNPQLKSIECGWLVGGQPTFCFGDDIGIYTGIDQWLEPDLKQMSITMRKAYQKWYENQLQLLQENARQTIKQFDYKNIGRLMLWDQ